MERTQGTYSWSLCLPLSLCIRHSFQKGIYYDGLQTNGAQHNGHLHAGEAENLVTVQYTSLGTLIVAVWSGSLGLKDSLSVSSHVVAVPSPLSNASAASCLPSSSQRRRGLSKEVPGP